MSVLRSLKSKYTKSIIEGGKRYEFRNVSGAYSLHSPASCWRR